MMKIKYENLTFEIQARTDLATSKNGTELKKINATIFSGFAAKEDGNASMQVELASDLEKNEAPEISGQESIKVVVNQSIVLNFTGHDDKSDFRYSIIDQPVGGSFTSDTSTGNLTLTWTPANLNTDKIRVTTVDSDGLTADAIEVVILACSGCSGDQGKCDYDNLRNESNPNYLIASCNCTTGWSGDDCDINTDGCADDPCVLERTCIDLSPPDEVKCMFWSWLQLF
ncbi:mucin-like protein [Mytilus galloprovincialis]|uniref:mucin-like protein n=1 Tax=Mytilus galloprovincialis TaxID=29158 RepID=UPI003F7C10DF